MIVAANVTWLSAFILGDIVIIIKQYQYHCFCRTFFGFV
jgi:hypothetical protein